MKKYRSESTRLQNWDYSSSGDYFITLCTKNRRRYFGSIANKKIDLSSIDEIAKQCWEDIPNHANYVTLGAFCIMPDHIHGIITINNPHNIISSMSSKKPEVNKTSLNAHLKQKKDKNKSLFDPRHHSKISPKKDSIATIIRSYKSAVSKLAHQAGHEFSWQPKYYDHIIRNKRAYDNITQYIIDNPKNWIP